MKGRLQGINSRTFVADGLEIIEKPGEGTIQKIHYLTGGDGSLFAMYVIDQNNQGKMYYIYTDHLGSPSLITDAECNVVQELSFDAWGNRRDPATWQPYTSLASIPSPLIDRGFTFHEHLYPFTLINMNGRAYDPLVGRFLSADPYIQAPDNPQNLNRYSYCLNNPLKYSDPTGNEWWNLWLVELMDWINGGTEDIRQQMVDAGIPSFNIGGNMSSDGQNWGVHGGLNRSVNASYDSEMGLGFGYDDGTSGEKMFYYPWYNYSLVVQNAMNDYNEGREEAIKKMNESKGNGYFSSFLNNLGNNFSNNVTQNWNYILDHPIEAAENVSYNIMSTTTSLLYTETYVNSYRGMRNYIAAPPYVKGMVDAHSLNAVIEAYATMSPINYIAPNIYGIDVNARVYPNSNGCGINFYYYDRRVLGFDWHEFGSNGIMINRPHIDAPFNRLHHWPW